MVANKIADRQPLVLLSGGLERETNPALMVRGEDSAALRRIFAALQRRNIKVRWGVEGQWFVTSVTAEEITKVANGTRLEIKPMSSPPPKPTRWSKISIPEAEVRVRRMPEEQKLSEHLHKEGGDDHQIETTAVVIAEGGQARKEGVSMGATGQNKTGPQEAELKSKAWELLRTKTVKDVAKQLKIPALKVSQLIRDLPADFVLNCTRSGCGETFSGPKALALRRGHLAHCGRRVSPAIGREVRQSAELESKQPAVPGVKNVSPDQAFAALTQERADLVSRVEKLEEELVAAKAALTAFDSRILDIVPSS